MKYLITGGAGFIGSHLADSLIRDGHQVHIIDNLSTGSLDNIQHLVDHENFKSTIADIVDYHTLEQLVANCDQIFHLAAAVGVKLIMEQPVETLTTNVSGTEHVLKLAHLYDKKVLVASTSEVYGKILNGKNRELLKEDGDWMLGASSKRRWAYACSKALDEFMALAYYDEKDLPVVVTRFFNTVGPRQTGRYGMVIPRFVERALNNEPIPVHGDGSQSRSFTHVSDAVRAVRHLMETPSAEGEIFNVGNHSEITIEDLAKRVIELTDSSSEIDYIPYEEVYGKGFEDMERRTPDLTKINGAIGYEPSYTIDQILQSVIEHARHEEVRLKVVGE